MTPTEADALALTIAHTWRTSPPATIWAEELVGLHYAQAEATYRKLRRESETAPSIARFLHTYHALTRPELLTWTMPNTDGPVLSFGQYLDTLIVKAAGGDPDAADMLDVWQDNETRNLSISKPFREVET
jgi:hypothetical protein